MFILYFKKGDLYTKSINMIVLQGMCYSGKTTLGAILAREYNIPFVDSRDLFQRVHNMSETEYLSSRGREAFCNAEKESIRQITLEKDNMVLSLGGSACYYEAEMEALKEHHTVIWLNVAFPEIQRRREAEGTDRPIVFPEGIETFQQLYRQRKELYRQYCHVEIEVENKTPIKEVVQKIVSQMP